MVEGKLQVEGEVIHVIVQQCYNFSRLLRHLTPEHDEDPPVLTLSHSDEKSVPVHRRAIAEGEKCSNQHFSRNRDFK